MSKLISAILFFACATGSFVGCSTVAPYVQSAQAWLQDPKNQAIIQAIIAAAGGLMQNRAATASTEATVAGKLAEDPRFKDVPAGAIVEIVRNPSAYVKK